MKVGDVSFAPNSLVKLLRKSCTERVDIDDGFEVCVEHGDEILQCWKSTLSFKQGMLS